MFHKRLVYYAATLVVTMTCTIALAQAPEKSAEEGSNNCGNLPNNAALRTALASALSAENSGLNNQMWATIVDRDGNVCAVGVLWHESGRAVAWQPRRFGTEGQYS